jgi:2,5-diketo-D-gluconate reductase A
MTPTTVTLNDENTIPVIGLGVGELSDSETEQSVSAALEAGYRLIDTASAYGNEKAVGRASAASGVPRDELFVTTKLATKDQGFQASQDALQGSLERLGLDYVDLYLIHWPAGNPGKYVDSWGGLMKRREDGFTKSIGVSNFHAEDLSNVIDLSFFTPAVNQIELHPYFSQQEMRKVHEDLGIQTECWSPLGKRNAPFDERPVAEAAEAHQVTPGQVILRWHLQLGALPLPKSADPRRQRQNLDVFGFELSDDEMQAINGLARPDGRLFGGDPDTHEEM